MVLGAAEGRPNHALAKELGISRPTLLLWRQRYVDAGVAGLLKDAPRPGRKKRIRAEKVEAIVNATLHTTPADATHWSVRTLAKRQRVSPATVHRIWQAHNLQPHRVAPVHLCRLVDPDALRVRPPAVFERNNSGLSIKQQRFEIVFNIGEIAGSQNVIDQKLLEISDDTKFVRRVALPLKFHEQSDPVGRIDGCPFFIPINSRAR